MVTEHGTAVPPAGTPRPISRRDKIVGLVAIVLAFVALGVALELVRARPQLALPASVAPSPRPTITPVVIPDEARTTLYRSGTPATGVLVTASETAEPTVAATTTNDYVVEVEEGTNIDPDAAAQLIQSILDDPRGWASYGRNNFRLTDDPGAASLVVTLASPDTTDELCDDPDATDGLWSCYREGRVVLNSDRWHYMVPAWNNADEHRAWLVNHHVGLHLQQGVAFCQGAGLPAPVMAEQTTDLGGCLPNAWPQLND